MKRLPLIIVSFGLFVLGPSRSANTSSSFDQRLSQDRQIVHVLDRLMFGPRPGDVEAVGRIGVARWIKLQLHPDQIAENPDLETKLKAFETARMDLPDIVKEYGTPQQSMMMAQQPQVTMNTLLSHEDADKVLHGTAEDRTAVMKSLDPDKRQQVLGLLPANVLKYTPEFQEEGEEAQKALSDVRRQEARRRNPQLSDLLSPDQMKIANSGSEDKLSLLFASLDPEKRVQLAGMLSPQRMMAFPELRREGLMLRFPWRVASDDAKDAKVLHALYSNRQLEGVLVDFWFNHFNIFEGKNLPGSNSQLMLLTGRFERDAIRPHVFGHFKDLLLATARHPAMLYYLDNWESMAPNGAEVGPFAPNRGMRDGVPNSILPSPLARLAHGLNENYGREVMELHTLGVKGGYTQDDVIAVARCFTGWTVRSPDDPQFAFATFMHDYGEKKVLGHKIAAGGGEQDGMQVIDILAHHPSTAKFISRELAQRFVADDPPQSLVDRMAQTFRKTDGDLRAVMETMFNSREFMSQGAYQVKVKSPFEMVVSAVRAVGGETSDASMLVQKIAELGEPLYGKVEPNGYSNTGEAWLSSAGLVGRMNFSAALVYGRFPGVTPDPAELAGKDASAIVHDLLGHDASPQTQSAIARGLDGSKSKAPTLVESLVLESPDFQRR